MTARAPRVSVIIPTYNRRPIVGDAIDSVLAQTYTDYEIVVMDDGSTDDTSELIEQRYRGTPVVYRRQKNQGCSAARNAAIRAARGELIAFLDSDDLWLPRKLELQVPLFDRNPRVGFAFCGSAIITPAGEIDLRIPTEAYRGRVVRAMIRKNMMRTSTILVRNDLVPSVGYMYEDLSFGEDLNYWLRVAARCEVDFVPEILVHYRVTPGSLSEIDFESFRRSTVGLFEALFRDTATAALFEPYRKEAMSQAHALVAAQALDISRFDVARRESWKAIRTRVANRDAWRVLPRALLGKRIHGTLRRWRHVLTGQRQSPD